MGDSVTVVYVNHTADHSPNDVVTVSEDEARRLVEAGMARVVTEDDGLEASVEAELADANADDAAAETASAKKK